MQNATRTVIEQMSLYGCSDIPVEFDPIPEDRDFAAATSEMLGMLFGSFENTPMERYSEELGWGIVNVFNRARTRLEQRIDDLEMAQRQTVGEQDGSEVMSVELETQTAKLHALKDHNDVMDDMMDALCEQYAVQAGQPWTPRRGGRKSGKRITSAIIDAGQVRKARARLEYERLNPVGRMIGFAGGPDYQDYETIFAVLDQIAAKYPDMILVHGGQKKGAELIASKWANAKGVTQKTYLPDFEKHKVAAPFRRNDEIVTDGLDALVVFPGNGITKNLMQKSAAAGVPVWERGRA